MDEKITLTHWEFWRCVQVANLRMAVANSRGMNHAISTHRPLLQRLREEVIGACGECAVAKYLGRYWAPLEELDRFHDVPDVLPNIEVRSTHHDKGKLTMYPTDKRDRIYICVTGDALGVAKDEMAAKPLVLYESDGLVALASEEIAIRAIIDREIDTYDPYEGEVLVWQR